MEDVGDIIKKYCDKLPAVPREESHAMETIAVGVPWLLLWARSSRGNCLRLSEQSSYSLRHAFPK